MQEKLKIIEKDFVPIYENNNGKRLINARELHKALNNKRKFSDWIKQRIITFHNFVKYDQKDNLGSKMIKYCIKNIEKIIAK